MKGSIVRGKHRLLIIIASSAVLVLLWWAGSRFFSEVILPSPFTVLGRFLEFLGEASFYQALSATFIRGVQGFAISLAAGSLAGILAGGSKSLEALFTPLLSVIKATPVMSVILLAFIWFRTGTVPVFAAFLMAFPVVTQNVMIGVREVPRELRQMARIYELNERQQFFHITLPSILPFFISGARSALGLTWKVVVAAEVLTVPSRGIGSGMQFAQINLATAEVFAWTIAAILLCALSDLLFSAVTPLFQPHRRRTGRHHGN